MDYSFAPGVIAEGRLFAFDSDSQTNSSPLRAFDLQTQRELWRAEGFVDHLIVAADDGVYVTGLSERVLFALDAATGKIEAEISIGSSFDVSIEPIGGAAGPLLVVRDLYVGQWILGRVDPAPTPESYLIRGRLSPTEGLSRRRVAGVRVQVVEQVVKTDKQGRFSARGATLGVIPVSPADDFYEYQEADYGRSRVAFDPRKVVLEGKGTYELGDISAYEVWSE
jgi:hypothetical protein